MTAFGTTQPWAQVLFTDTIGTGTDRGIVTLLAALGVSGLAAWRTFFALRERTYVIAGIFLAVLTFIMPLWFLIDIWTKPLDEFYLTRNIVASGGLYFTIIVASGMLAALSWHAYKWLPHRGDADSR